MWLVSRICAGCGRKFQQEHEAGTMLDGLCKECARPILTPTTALGLVDRTPQPGDPRYI